MKKITFPILFLLSTIAFSQETAALKSNEKFKFGVGVESMTYLNNKVNSMGYKFQLDLPIYKKLGASIGYIDHSTYSDTYYCGDIPVNVDERHLVVGLNYVILDRSKWTIAALAGIDIERTRYTERRGLQRDIALLQNERSDEHEGFLNSTEGFVEVLFGFEVGYQLTDRFQLNYSARVNTYGSFRNSLSLNYVFDLRKKKSKRYID